MILFVNELDDYVTLYKIDENLKLRSYNRIRPGGTYTTMSLLGTNWHVKKGTVDIATFPTERGKNTAVIDGRDPIPSLPDVPGLAKKSMPSSSDRKVATKEVNKLYGDLISNAKSPPASRKVAESIIEDARDSSDDLAAQFVMFDTVKDMAVSTGDCKSAMVALREIDRRFEDYDFWDEAVEVVEDSGRNLGRTGDRFLAHELETVLKGLIDEANMSGESRSAGKLASYGMKAASRKGDAKAERFYENRFKESKEFTKLEKQYESALVKLAADPDNSIANIQKGRYLMVVKRDFNAAIECWSLSDDKELLDIVEGESSGDNPSFLAQRWQNLGKDPETAFGRRCFERAITVFESAGKTRKAKELQEELQKVLDQ